ncbi:hypothetical protein EMCRGX_G027288 [Ephydatia muelleri]
MCDREVADKEAAMCDREVADKEAAMCDGEVADKEAAMCDREVADKEAAMCDGEVADKEAAMCDREVADKEAAMCDGEVADKEAAMCDREVADKEAAMCDGEVADKEAVMCDGEREEEAAVPRTVVQTVRAEALNSSENGPGPEQGSRADNGHVLDQKWKSLKSPDQAWKLEQSVLIRREGIKTNTPKSKVLGERFGKPSFIQMQPNARAILARLDLDQVCRPSMLPGFVDPAVNKNILYEKVGGI